MREADLSECTFNEKTNFEGAKIHGMKIKNANISVLKDVQVDVSVAGNDLEMTSLADWLKKLLSSSYLI